MRLVANLLARESANLVLGVDAADSEVDASSPLKARLAALRGKRIGIANGPVPRLLELLQAAGMSVGDVHIEVIAGPQQNQALSSGRVDALFAHTPYLERAIDQGHGIVWIHTSRGEIPALQGLVVHALVCRDEVLDGRRDAIRALLRALEASREIIANDPERAATALAAATGEPVTAEIRRIVEIYRPAMPASLTPEAGDLAATIALFPALGAHPPTEPAALARFIDKDPMAAPALRPYYPYYPPLRGGKLVVLAAGAAALGLCAIAYVLSRRRRHAAARGSRRHGGSGSR